MNTAKGRIVRALSIIGAAGVSVIGAGHVAGAEGSMSWAPFTDGCYYLTDGSAHYERACARGDGAWEYSTAIDGQWHYDHSVNVNASGCLVAWNNSGVLAERCPQPAVTNSTMGGESVVFPDVRITGPGGAPITPGSGYTTIGGQGLDYVSPGLTGNPLIDLIMIDAQFHDASIWM